MTELNIITALYGRAQGEAPAGMWLQGDQIKMMPGSRSTTVDGQDINSIWVEMQARLAAFNQFADAKAALLSFPVARETEKVGVPRNATFQRASELGRPTKVRVEYVGRAFPLVHYDLAYGYSQEFLDYATGAQITAVEASVRSAWITLRRNIILAALFDDTNGTHEALTIRRLYNADGEVPPKFKRWTHSGSHTHYQVSAGASLADADIETLEEHLIHHGFGEGDAQLVIHFNRAEYDDIAGLTNWVPAQSADRPAIVLGTVLGTTPTAARGLPVQGYINRFSFVEDNDIPAGYLLAYASGGVFAPENPVGVRYHENPSARGLRLVQGPNGRYPLIDAVYDGYMGAGIRQRGAAVCMQITGGAYTVPTFDSP